MCMEQFVRDARIAQIYEGTNGVQAMDLLYRKVVLDGARALKAFANPIEAYVRDKRLHHELAEFAVPVEAALRRLQEATAIIIQRADKNPEEIGAAATDYLRLFGLTSLGYLWCLMAEVSLPKRNDDFHRAKLATARFYMQRILPQTAGLHAAVMAGAASVMELDEAAF